MTQLTGQALNDPNTIVQVLLVQVQVFVDPDSGQFFDPDTGLGRLPVDPNIVVQNIFTLCTQLY